MKRIAAGLIVGFLVGCGAPAALGGTDNDHVLGEDRYAEYFKQEGGGDKNYLYTVTYEVDAPAPGKCVVVTGASETTMAAYCNDAPR